MVCMSFREWEPQVDDDASLEQALDLLREARGLIEGSRAEFAAYLVSLPIAEIEELVRAVDDG
jgi:hypothetical protein